MRIPGHAALRWMAAIACAIGFAAAAAQSPAVSPKEAKEANQQAAQQTAQPLNNQPVWSEVRSGQPQYTSIPGRETNVLIQPQGQTWRAARVPLATTGGFLFAAALIVLAVFYVWRGPITVRGPPSGHLIERFTLVERTVHWSVAIAFTTLAVTGLVITFGKAVLLPLIGYTLFSWLAILAKNLHNFVGPLLVVLLPVMIVMFVHENIFRSYDWNWLKKGGGMLTGEHVPSGKANAGQKVLFWIMVVLCGLTLVVTGLILDFPNFNQVRATMQAANVVHMIAGMIAIILLSGHIYLGTIGMRGALDAMRTGYVDETWAREHHEYWYNEVKSGKAKGEGAPTGGMPAARNG
ncbi:MAG TPA: formate dehydrogenase subunit gamma [Casimicrobiaceae bacterium]|nr:formate dehydrogenase subunit gamma [Casimicrobiaceae bacterium]